MADVNRAAGTDGRGQLILVSALSLAVLFVALALIVNTAIYTENLAMRSSDIGGGTDAVRYQDATWQSVAGSIEYANYHDNTSYDSLQAALRDGLEVYQNASGRQMARSNRAVEVELNGSTNGTRISQTDASRNFSNRSGSDASWTLASDVTNTREFRMNVTQGDLLNITLLNDPFAVEVTNGTNSWTMYVYEDDLGPDIIVEVENDTGTVGTCRAEDVPSAWINISSGTLAGEDCDPLNFAEGVSGNYELRYQNPEHVSGTYTVIVDNDSITDSPGPHLHDPVSGQPFATHAVYSARLDVTYQTPRLWYRTTVRVAPGETR